MPKSIVVMGTLDTKGDQLEYIKESIEGRGQQVILLDIGVLGQAMCDPDITNQQVAHAAGTTLEQLVALKDEAKAMDKMTEGASRIVHDLLDKGHFDGILAVGGSMGTSSALKIMNELPLDLPKVMLSTLAYSHAIDPEWVSNGIIMIQWAGGLWGINEVVQKVLKQSAAIIAAAADAYETQDMTKRRKTVCISSLGATGSTFMKFLKPALEKQGIEAVVYHATGMNTSVMEKAISEGYFDAVLDLQVDIELMGYTSGSLLGAASHRLEAAAEKGIPQIVLMRLPHGTGGCLWAPYKPIPPEYVDNMRFIHNDLLWVLGVNPEQTLEMAKLMARKLNRSKGPTALIVTKKPDIPLDHTAGGGSYEENPELLNKVLSIVKENLKPEIKLIELNCSTREQEFADQIVRVLNEMMQS